jgi:hypothetical protein
MSTRLEYLNRLATNLAVQVLYMRSLARQLEHNGVPILVHAVHPGVTEGGLQRCGVHAWRGS